MLFKYKDSENIILDFETTLRNGKRDEVVLSSSTMEKVIDAACLMADTARTAMSASDNEAIRADLATATERIAALEGALRPFATLRPTPDVKLWHIDMQRHLTSDDFKQAAALLGDGEEGRNEKD